MKTKLRRYRFNLIEIVLAIVILTLGMTSVFVLFPVGLNNHTDAMAENSIADMAETIISHIRATVALEAKKDGFGALTFKKYSELGSEPEVSFEVDSSDKWTYKDMGNGYHIIRQLSGPAEDPYVDFAAVARVYLDEGYEDELFVPFSLDDSDVKYVKSDCDLSASDVAKVRKLSFENTVLPLVVEISYPADRPYAERKKAYFRFEIFNEMYEVKEND